MLQSVFLWFYCLPIWKAVFFVILATLGFRLVRQKVGGKLWWRACLGAVLIAWTAVVVYATVAGREAEEGYQHFFVPFHSYRAVMNGGNPEILRSNLMNVLLFYPAGLLAVSLLPEKLPRRSRVVLVLVLFATVSAGIEFAQYVFELGQAEIDDVIHNTLGAAIGAMAGSIRLRRKRK